MADKKITQLNNITGANLANTDEFVVVDVSADETMAVTREEFFKNTPNITVDGDVTIGDDLFITGPSPLITLTDNDVANEYTKLYNVSGNTFLDSRNGAANGLISFRGAGGGVIDEYARFTAAGNFGIGNTSPQALLYVGGNDTILGGTAGNDLNLLTLHAKTSNNDLLQFTSERLTTGTDWTTAAHRIQRKIDASLMGYMQFGNFTSDLITFGENATEYMRIDGGGNVLVGGKASSNITSTGVELTRTGKVYVSGTGNQAYFNRSGTGNLLAFYSGGGLKGTISVSASNTAFNTTSDYRLKENVTPIQGAADVVMAMKPCTYTAIADGLWYDGFLAHELQEVHPRAVQGTKDAMMDEEYEVTPAVYEDVVTPAVDAVAATYDDEGLELTPAVEAVSETTENTLVTEAVMGTRSVPDMQAVDYSKLTPILTAALQEALTKIDALETRITALEG